MLLYVGDLGAMEGTPLFYRVAESPPKKITIGGRVRPAVEKSYNPISELEISDSFSYS